MNFKSKLADENSLLFQYVFFIKWLIIAIISGIVIGICGSGFHILLDLAAEKRAEYPFLLFLLPIGGLVIVWLYQMAGMSEDKGTNGIIRGARGEETVSVKKAPLIVVATALTHLLGGSAGREGAALQLGGSLISPLKKPLKLNDEDYSMLIMCGMAAGFSALFGTPVAAAVFAIEVTVVGVTKYRAIVPCIVASLAAAMTANGFMVHPTSFSVKDIPGFDIDSYTTMIQTTIMGICCAVISVLFCVAMSRVGGLYKKYFPNPYIRALVGGIIVAALSELIFLLTGSFDYNGAGTDVIANAFAGSARPEAFILKLILTALTLGAGYKGGEIVPSMFIGATFGCFFGALMGLPASFGAALGLAGVFCGVTNCPFASMLLSIELFGAEALPYYALVIGLSYMLSGYTGLYSAQKFYESKIANSRFRRRSTYSEIKKSIKENAASAADNDNKS